MRSISFRDLKLVPELANFNEIQLLSLDMDSVMEPILAKLGFDTDYPIQYIASNHRDMQNKVAVGFRVVGELQCNREFVNSGLCDTYERIAISSYTDHSLTRELFNLQNTSLNWSSFHSEDEEGTDDDFSEEYAEANEQELVAQINQLHEIRDFVRGTPFNRDGSLKTFEDYRRTNELRKKEVNGNS